MQMSTNGKYATYAVSVALTVSVFFSGLFLMINNMDDRATEQRKVAIEVCQEAAPPENLVFCIEKAKK
jgi:hypothetical protein